MPAAGPVRDAGEGTPLLRRRMARCLVLAGGTVAAWLLASGIASANEADAVNAPASAAAAPVSWLPVDADGSFLGGPSSPSDPGGMSGPTGTPHARALAGRVAMLADQHAPAGLPALGELPAPIGFPADIGPPGAIVRPGPTDFGELTIVRPPAHPRPVTPLSGDSHQPGMVVAPPAVAADAIPAPAVRVSAPTDPAGAGTSPASAATPGHRTSTPSAPADEQRCPPSPALPAPAPAPAGAVSVVETVPAARSVGSGLHVRVPRRGHSATSSVANQPGTTPD